MNAQINGSGNINWTTEGDGNFLDSQSLTTSYVLGIVDILSGQTILHLNVENDCYSVNDSLVLILEPCLLQIVNFELSDCDNNQTPNDSNDDLFTVSFNISASYPGLDSTFLAVVDSDTVGVYTYDTEHNITLPADGVLHLIKFVDAQIEDCFVVQAVEVENCSDQCELDLMQLIVTDCDDNGTPNDLSDDIYSINFNIEAINSGLDSTYYAIIDNDTIEGFTYGDNEIIILYANNNSGTIQFVDGEFEYCFKTINVGVENCIYPCELSMDEFIISECDANETFDDNSDDFFTVTFNISSSYPGLDSTYFVVIGANTLGPFPYESEQMITLPANGMDNIINFVDSEFTDCIISEIVNVVSCSIPCELSLAQFDVSECDDNGTSQDPSDDFYWIDFNIAAQNPGVDSMYLLIVDNDTLGQFHYDTEQVISLPADGLDKIIQFVDTQIGSCLLSEIANVESCSHPCELFLDQFIVSACEDNDTPDDNTDDLFTITFNISAFNPGLDSLYYVINGSDTLGLFTYNTEQYLTLSANGLDHELRFIDSQFAGCELFEVVNVESCSYPCILTMEDFQVSACDDSGTPNDLSDDMYEVTFNISASNTGGSPTYVLTIADDTIGVFLYDTQQSILLIADDQNHILMFTDSQISTCSITESIDLVSCFG